MDYSIANIAFVVLCALCSGLTLSALGHTPILGYIIAGIILGPSGFKFITDKEAVHVFSEMGILFLLFIIGLGLSFDKVKKIWKSSFAVTFFSFIGCTLTAVIFGKLLGWSNGVIILSAFCATLSSTAVTVKAIARLKEKISTKHPHDTHKTEDNKNTIDINEQKNNESYDIENSSVGILIMQDLFALVMIITLQSFGTKITTDFTLYKILPSLLLFLFIFLYFKIYHRHVHKFTNFLKKHEELLALATFSICLGGSVWAELAGLSAPFGAFLAGVMMGNSDIKDHLKSIASTFEEILLMTFFLAVGLLVDLKFAYTNFWSILIALLLVTLGKTLLNFSILRFLKFSLKESFIISVLLGHLGEFSFLLSQIALKNKIISDFGVDFLITLTALSLFFSPFWLIFAQRCEQLSLYTTRLSPGEIINLALNKEYRRFYVFYHLFKKSVLFILSPILNQLNEEKQKNKKITNHNEHSLNHLQNSHAPNLPLVLLNTTPALQDSQNAQMNTTDPTSTTDEPKLTPTIITNNQLQRVTQPTTDHSIHKTDTTINNDKPESQIQTHPNNTNNKPNAHSTKKATTLHSQQPESTESTTNDHPYLNQSSDLPTSDTTLTRNHTTANQPADTKVNQPQPPTTNLTHISIAENETQTISDLEIQHSINLLNKLDKPK